MIRLPSMLWNEAELKRIERDAYKIIRERAKQQKPRRVTYKAEADKDREKAANAYARRVKKYRETTGKTRLSADEKKALHDYTPAQVKRHYSKGGEALYERRAKTFAKTYGKNYEKKYSGNKEIEEVTSRLFEFLTPSQVAKVLEVEKDEQPEQKSPMWEEFSAVSLPVYTWNSLPAEIKKWPHASGSFLNQNQDVFWNGSPSSPLNLQAIWNRDGLDGYDHIVHDFFSVLINKYGKDLYFDPMGADVLFLVGRKEWEEAETLAPDYVTSRKYIKKEG